MFLYFGYFLLPTDSSVLLQEHGAEWRQGQGQAVIEAVFPDITGLRFTIDTFIAATVPGGIRIEYDAVTAFDGYANGIVLEQLWREIEHACDGIFRAMAGLPVTISGGVCSLANEDANGLVMKADRFLYRAKNSGRNRIEAG